MQAQLILRPAQLARLFASPGLGVAREAMAQHTDEARGATVTMYPDGPLIVRGDFEIRDVDGTPVDAGRTVALCRCGRSAVKPLCDGSHKRGALAEPDPS